jgi:N-acyl-L-homoserine lactone synthetase
MPYLISTVASASHEDQAYVAHTTVRHAVYVSEMHWLGEAGEHPTRECDEYDSHASMAVAYDVLSAGRPVGAIRNISGGVEGKLPVQTYFGIAPANPAATAEVSRFSVLSEYRKTPLMLGLCRWVVHDATTRGIVDLYATVEPGLLASLNAIGFPFEAVSDLKSDVMGAPVLAAHCAVADLVAGVVETDRRFPSRRPLGPYFSREFEEYFDEAEVLS